jgi:TRAP-type C4-dicarboxylate transport system permease large subunit
MGLLPLLGLFAVCVSIGVPVAFALAVAAIATFAYEGIPLLIGFKRIVSGISVVSLLAIPFFIFAGELMLRGGIATRLINLAAAAVGWMRGGLGVENVASSMLFGGISGSAVADVSALGSLLIPVMKRKGFSADYAVNVTAYRGKRGTGCPTTSTP